MMISHMRGLFLSHNLQEFSLLETVFSISGYTLRMQVLHVSNLPVNAC